jgi:hypothetical protein
MSYDPIAFLNSLVYIVLLDGRIVSVHRQEWDARKVILDEPDRDAAERMTIEEWQVQG